MSGTLEQVLYIVSVTDALSDANSLKVSNEIPSDHISPNESGKSNPPVKLLSW